jgi:hypothetical protein
MKKLESLSNEKISRSNAMAVIGGQRSFRIYSTENWGGSTTRDAECVDNDNKQ